MKRKEYLKKWYEKNKSIKAEYGRKRWKRIRFTKEIKIKSCLRNARRNAYRKNLKFDLDLNWLKQNVQKGCNLTGIQFKFKNKFKTLSNPYVPSIDRRNPKKGYTKRNCQVILWGINAAKGQMNMKEFKEFLKVFKFIK